HEVVDLRTGKPAGRFAWRAPVWLRVRLGPDGQYLVGADVRPDGSADGMAVWKREEPSPVARLAPVGAYVWWDFLAADGVAVQTAAPARVLRVGDGARGEKLLSARLPDAEFKPPAPSYAVAGAVSPGGRYVALGGKGSVVLVSAAEGKVA